MFLVTSAGVFLFPAVSATEDALAKLERRNGGRLGVAALDMGSRQHIRYRADERFAMCSTFKLLAVAAILHRIDLGRESLDRSISYGQADLLAYAPIARAHVGKGQMSVAALCAAAIEWSDNTAANLLLAALGGPRGYTQYARSIGDHVTRLDRVEPALNAATPGDPRDTTTPAAMLASMKTVLLGPVLSEASRARLSGWLKQCTTGKDRIRAGLPAGWEVGDKTGSGMNNGTNDIAIIWPPGRAPILVAAYYTGSREYSDKRNAVIAEVGRIVASRFA